MRLEDTGWAAGFFEGEGNLQLYPTNGGFGGMVQVSQKDRTPLDALQQFFGGKVKPFHASVAAGVNYTWQWTLNGKYALPFLEAILSHIRTAHKRQEIKKYQKFYSTTDHDERMHILMWWVSRVERHKKACSEELLKERLQLVT